jgi:hypothetical protein
MENLATYGKKLEELPFVLQYNKRDLRQILPVQQMNALLNPRNVPAVEGIAKEGVGVSETLVTISRMVFSNLRKTLLMPGEAAEHKEIGDLAGAKIQQSLRPRESEPLEEISEIEEIPEVREVLPEAEEPVSVEAVDSVPDEIEIEISGPAPVPPAAIEFRKKAPPPASVEEPAASRGGLLEGMDEIEIEIPEPAPPATREFREMPPPPASVEEPAASRGGMPEGLDEIEIPEPAPPAAEKPIAPAPGLPESGDEIEIEVPVPAPAPPLAREPRVGVSLEAESEGFTFLNFETPYVAPEGHAVLPAVFMDDRGNIVRLRIRITMEERG